MEGSFLTDPHFADELIKFLIFDRNFLKQAAHLLAGREFRFDKHGGTERKAVATMALDFWKRYRQPLGNYFRMELKEYARKSNWEGANKQRLLDYGETLMKGKRVAADAMLAKVIQFRTESAVMNGITAMQNAMEHGVLSTDEFMAIARKAVEEVGKEEGRPVSIFSNDALEQRIARRFMQQRRQRFPVLLIDPIDRMIRIIARKHLGIVLAPYGRGKTLFFVWIALAYVLQGYNVLYFTLEDPLEDVEDRFDAAITSLPMARLAEMPNRVRERFQRYKKMLRTRLKVVDGTDGAVTIGTVEHVRERERNRGFNSDVTIVDYDDEIRPERKQLERRFEFADIYRDYRAYLARTDQIGWTGSQTTRKSEDMKIFGGKEIAEDISKIRKASFAGSLGLGDWGEDSLFFWVSKHRYDMDRVGANIFMAKDKALFYDRERTLKKEIEERNKEERG